MIRELFRKFGFIHVDELNKQKNSERIQEIKQRIEHLEYVRHFNCEMSHSDNESDEDWKKKDLWADEYNAEINELERELKKLEL